EHFEMGTTDSPASMFRVTRLFREGNGPTETVVLHGSMQVPLGCHQIYLRNTTLTDLYQDQINMIHVRMGKERKVSKNMSIDETRWTIAR
nr:hypothetical protein [Saprospiraceae bacterium]